MQLRRNTLIKWPECMQIYAVYAESMDHDTLERRFALRHNYICITKEVIPAKMKAKTPKLKALLEEGTLNPRPGKVRDPKFQENEFFDPRDLVQVKV